MPLVARNEIQAKDNPFISELAHYQDSLDEIRLHEEKGADAAIRAQTYNKCFNHYFSAITQALDVASRETKSTDETNEKRDFLEWLRYNRLVILGSFSKLSSSYIAISKPKEAADIMEQGDKIDKLIEALVGVAPFINPEILENFHLKQREIDQAAGQSRMDKFVVRRIYFQRFCEFLRALVTYNALSTWRAVSENKEWINRHYETIRKLLSDARDVEAADLGKEWNTFNDAVELVEQRGEQLTRQVQASVELCITYNHSTLVERAIAALRDYLEDLGMRFNAAKKNVKSVARRALDVIATTFGTILWPIIAPTLWLSDKITSRGDLSNYNGYIKQNWSNAYSWARANPWLALGAVLIAGLSIAFPFAHIGWGVAALVVVSSGATYAVCRHSRNQKINELQQRFKYEENMVKLSNKTSILSLEAKREGALSAAQKDFSKRDEYEDLAKAVHLHRKARAEKQSSVAELKSVNTSEEKATIELRKQVAELMNEMTREDIESARKESTDSLRDFESKRAIYAERGKVAKNILSEGEVELRKIDFAQSVITHRYNSTALELSPKKLIEEVNRTLGLPDDKMVFDPTELFKQLANKGDIELAMAIGKIGISTSSPSSSSSSCASMAFSPSRMLPANKTNIGLKLRQASNMNHLSKEDFLTLVREAKTVINEQSSNGWTALHWATDKGHQEIVSILLDAKIDVTIQDKRGLTALDHANEKGYEKIKSLLEAVKNIPGTVSCASFAIPSFSCTSAK